MTKTVKRNARKHRRRAAFRRGMLEGLSSPFMLPLLLCSRCHKKSDAAARALRREKPAIGRAAEKVARRARRCLKDLASEFSG